MPSTKWNGMGSGTVKFEGVCRSTDAEQFFVVASKIPHVTEILRFIFVRHLGLKLTKFLVMAFTLTHKSSFPKLSPSESKSGK